MKKHIIKFLCISLFTCLSVYGQSSYCDRDIDCSSGETCSIDGVCLQSCDWDSDCDEGRTCIDGYCMPFGHELERP